MDNSITIQDVRLHPVGLPLAEKLRTSYGAEPYKSAVIVELITDQGVIGWGECPTKMKPSYGYETMSTALHILSEFLVPALIGKTIVSPTEVPGLLRAVRGHPMAQFSIEAAVWDAFAKSNEMTLAEAFAAHLPEGHDPRGYALVGVSIGIQESIEKTLGIIEKRLDQGYGRIKLKIEPGWDLQLAQAVREVYPDIMLMLDANSAYSLADVDHLKQFDAFDLLMLEQPLGFDDIYEHSKLQPQLHTSICLDESIHSADDARLAIALGACRIINLKPARVGGYTESLKIYQVCVDNEIPLWVGGLLETGVGRAANLAFASLPGVNLPCDISATDRYFAQDLTEPPFVLGDRSRIYTPSGAGVGVEVQRDRLEAASAYWMENYPYRYTPMMTGHADRRPQQLAEYIRGLDDFVVYEDCVNGHQHMASTLLEAVLIASGSGEDTRPRVDALRLSAPTAGTTSGLLDLIERGGGRAVLGLEAEPFAVVSRLAHLLTEQDIETESDLQHWFQDSTNVSMLRTVAGVDETMIDALMRMVGISHTGIDSRVRAFLRQAEVPASGYADAHRILTTTAAIMGLSAAALDHSIWRYAASD